MNEEQLKYYLLSQGYSDLVTIPGRGLCGLFRFVLTIGLCAEMDEEGYQHRWCYGSIAEARESLKTWDGVNDPPGDWIKHKGLGGDYSNVNKNNSEYAT